MPYHTTLFEKKLSAHKAQIIDSNIQPIYPHKNYKYANEQSINPAYQDSFSINKSLAPHEKRIWVLREDFILATGIKNAYQTEFGYDEFSSAFNKDIDLSSALNINDRFGHPSLTLNSQNKQIGVYYAGYISQKNNELSVFLASGRYSRYDLTIAQIYLLEQYISLLFQKAYQADKTTFYYGMRPYEEYGSDNDYYQHLGIFFNNTSHLGNDLLENEPKRHYKL